MDSCAHGHVKKWIRSGAVPLMMLLAIPTASAQQDTVWVGWHWLIGEWVGEGSGQPGQGSGSFSLTPDLDGHILVRKGHAEYPAMEEKPRIVHDDLMIINPAANGLSAKAVYYDNEGHIIEYGIVQSDTSISFTSSRLPKVPVFRLIYAKRPGGKITVSFQLSQDGEHFRVYTEGECRRK
jgi:hypothetical protein